MNSSDNLISIFENIFVKGDLALNNCFKRNIFKDDFYIHSNISLKTSFMNFFPASPVGNKDFSLKLFLPVYCFFESER